MLVVEFMLVLLGDPRLRPRSWLRGRVSLIVRFADRSVRVALLRALVFIVSLPVRGPMRFGRLHLRRILLGLSGAASRGWVSASTGNS